MAIATTLGDQRASAPASHLALVWGRFRRHRAGVVDLAVLVLMAVAVIVVPILSPYDVS